jgi:hypothetical protein
MVNFNNGKPSQVEIYRKPYQSATYYERAGLSTIRVKDIRQIISINEYGVGGTPLSKVMFKHGGYILISDYDASELATYM